MGVYATRIVVGLRIFESWQFTYADFAIYEIICVGSYLAKFNKSECSLHGEFPVKIVTEILHSDGYPFLEPD